MWQNNYPPLPNLDICKDTILTSAAGTSYRVAALASPPAAAPSVQRLLPRRRPCATPPPLQRLLPRHRLCRAARRHSSDLPQAPTLSWFACPVCWLFVNAAVVAHECSLLLCGMGKIICIEHPWFGILVIVPLGWSYNFYMHLSKSLYPCAYVDFLYANYCTELTICRLMLIFCMLEVVHCRCSRVGAVM